MRKTERFVEIVGNVHLHTRRSDGAGTHADVAAAARQAGLDFVIPTDHNVLALEEEGWRDGVLMLVGEETNDPQPPAASHYLAFGITRDVAGLSGDPQALIDEVRRQGGFGFIAHPYELPSRFIGEPALGWSHWDAQGYAGLGIWNYMSEFKSHITGAPAALWAALLPRAVIRGPFAETLARYDQLLAEGRRLAIIGESDAHALTYRLGPLKRTVYPYATLFRGVNLHLWISEPLRRELAHDRALVYEAMQRGRGYVAYHVLGDPAGFSFTARPAAGGASVTCSEEIAAGDGVIFEAHAPRPARLRLIHRGRPVAQVYGRRLVYRGREAGAYRLEAWRWDWLRWRGWIFSNPIYVM
jgi:hypothetical protein